MAKGKIGGNNAHEGEISIKPRDCRTFEGRGASKPVCMPNDLPTNKVTPATEYRVLEVARMISEGATKDSCIKYIQDSQKVGLTQARYYYQAAINWLIPEDMDKFKKELYAANIVRLEKIVEEGMKDNRNLKIAREAIDSLNKMIGITGNRVQIGEEKADGSRQIIQINFD